MNAIKTTFHDASIMFTMNKSWVIKASPELGDYGYVIEEDDLLSLFINFIDIQMASLLKYQWAHAKVPIDRRKQYWENYDLGHHTGAAQLIVGYRLKNVCAKEFSYLFQTGGKMLLLKIIGLRDYSVEDYAWFVDGIRVQGHK